MGTFSDQATFAARLEEVHAEARPCVLVFAAGGRSVEAAEGTPRLKPKISGTGFVTVKSCTFRIPKAALPTEPANGAVFSLQGLPSQRWKIASLSAGRSVNDAAWVIECEEEHKP